MPLSPHLQQCLRELRAELRYHSDTTWIKQLHKEHEQICFSFGIKLPRPIIALSESNTQWGSWDATTRTLAISRNLITTHHWRDVIAILKHEMAHQIVTDVFKCDRHHGSEFQSACEMLGLPNSYRKASIALAELPAHWRNESMSQEETRALRKAERLLALASSQNEYEATAAMEKVREILIRYRIDLTRAKTDAHHVTLTIETGRKRLDRSICRVTGILNDFFQVRIVYSSIYDASAEDSFKTIEVMGLRPHVITAEYVYHFLNRTIENLWNQFRKRSGAGVTEKASYQIGLLTGLRKKLESSESNFAKSRPQEENALIISSNRDLDAYVKRQFPRLSTKSERAKRVSSGSFHSGIRDGERITIHKAVCEKKGTKPLFLPPN